MSESHGRMSESRGRMSENRARILVVDDNPRYVRLIRINLEASGYTVLSAANGDEAIELAARVNPDLILLDINMPGKDGFDACQQIRQFSSVPIIMLTAFTQVESIVKGLDAGADDYITKPLSAEELLARIRARLRRAESAPVEGESICRFDGLTLDLRQRRLFVRGEEVHLTPTEYRLLVELVTQAGRILVPDHLLEVGWSSGEHAPQLLWQAIHRLRQKIEVDASNPQYIQTRSGIGYIFLAEKLQDCSECGDECG
jgi:two-component system, OmpR family, KDP operon response regulator KdpE